MRQISKLKRQRFVEKEGSNYIIQLWFNYHFTFFRSLIFRGLKLRAFNLFINIKRDLKLREFFDPAFIFFVVMLQITPSLFLKIFKIGSSSFNVPYPLDYWSKISYACRWIIKLLKDKNRTFSVKSIVDSFVLSLKEEGVSMNKKFEVYYTATINRHLIKNKLFMR